jgi:hypothetical protein
MTSYVAQWAWAFAFTQLVEMPLYRRLLGCSWVAAFGATLLTHPLIWWVFPYSPFGYLWSVLLAELFAWLVEACYFARAHGIRRALLAALLANAASVICGQISRTLLGVP